MTGPITIGEDFKPAPQFKTYYFLYLFLTTLLAAVFILFPVFLADEPVLNTLFAGGLIAVVIFVAVWIPLYYRSVVYHLGGTEMTWKRGVWFRGTGIVPYNRITNVDIVQGPLMRVFGISDLRIQTAGYSAQAQAEIRIQGVEEPEEVRELIMAQVRGRPPVAATTGGEETVPAPEDAVLAELQAIRRVLEGMTEKKE
ncbi:MAG: PH domain-containing protein [Methanofollis sp.]|uniref:PH domain-containing protein n=1 Tax=Methanofollis sp. TaxID=2052835 RepID=UPI00260601BE|nr:PH domain-containing protein [Methanofollis sp.]MDD4255539.1 PH domain-containing protein [Methanofollis sp.]